MSPIQIGVADTGGGITSPWHPYELAENPFPPTGVDADVNFEDHQHGQIRQINKWLGDTVDVRARMWSPLVLKGSVGVGKTHVLRGIERVLTGFREETTGRTVHVTRHTVPGISSRSLLLSSILAEGLRAPHSSSANQDPIAEFPLLQAALSHLDEDGVAALPPVSPLRGPLKRILAEKTPGGRAQLESALHSWLGRRDVPRAVLERLGVRGKLEGEGEAVRAYAHVARLARASIGLAAWVVLLDQIEDLWRRNEVTPAKRARFLTDLRTLIDEGLDGSPVAVVLAWNTDVVQDGQRRSVDISNPLRTEYVALWTRLPEAIDIPPLPREHVLPFALAYIDAARLHFRAAGGVAAPGVRPPSLESALRTRLSDVLKRVPDFGKLPDGSVVERAWLAALHDWAEEHVSG